VALPGPADGALKPALFDRIFYDPALEAAALRSLSLGDVAGCRRSLGRLVDRMSLETASESPRTVIQLLVDVLQRVNLRIHAPLIDPEGYQFHRVRLIERFSDCDDFEAARSRFLPTLNRLLALSRAGEGGVHPVVARAKRLIEGDYRSRISLSSIAGELNVSPNYLSRLFRREAGMTVTAYVHRVRLDHALELLSVSGKSLAEIAYEVGYQTYRDFYRNFVKHEDGSPRQVRQRRA